MNVFLVALIILFWCFSLVNESGWGSMMHTPDKMNYLILAWTGLLILGQKKYIPNLNAGLRLLMFIIFVFVAYLVSHKWDGASYAIAFLTVYCFSNVKLNQKELAVTAFTIGLLGAGLITIYQSTAILSGWNDNAIAMLTLYSFIFFSIHINEIQSKFFRCLYWGIAVWYLLQILNTDSRGAAVFMVLMMVLLLNREKTISLFCRPGIQSLIIHLPLIIAVLVVYVASTDMYQQLNTWSEAQTDKTIFNGRDELWLNAFNDIPNYPFGRGQFVINYHNSAVACIGVFGILGYWVWTRYFKAAYNEYAGYLNDFFVFGCLCAFTVIYLHQSVELGFITTVPNMLPYMILGLGLGRIRQYQTQQLWPR